MTKKKIKNRIKQKGQNNKKKRVGCLLPHSPIHPPTQTAEFTGQPGLLSAVFKTFIRDFSEGCYEKNEEIGFVYLVFCKNEQSVVIIMQQNTE